MSGIKTLADELRENIRKDGNAPTGPPDPQKIPTGPESKKDTPKKPDGTEELFARLQDFQLRGHERLFVRLDDRTVFLLKQLKAVKGIEMNKVIAFSLDQFLQQHPEIIQYIKENIKTIEL